MKVTITTCYKKEHKPQVVLNSQALSCIKLNFQKVEYLPLVKAALISQHAIMTVKTILRVQMNGLMIMVIPTPVEALQRQMPMKTENETVMSQSNDKILDKGTDNRISKGTTDNNSGKEQSRESDDHNSLDGEENKGDEEDNYCGMAIEKHPCDAS